MDSVVKEVRTFDSIVWMFSSLEKIIIDCYNDKWSLQTGSVRSRTWCDIRIFYEVGVKLSNFSILELIFWFPNPSTRLAYLYSLTANKGIHSICKEHSHTSLGYSLSWLSNEYRCGRLFWYCNSLQSLKLIRLWPKP